MTGLDWQFILPCSGTESGVTLETTEREVTLVRGASVCRGAMESEESEGKERRHIQGAR